MQRKPMLKRAVPVNLKNEEITQHKDCYKSPSEKNLNGNSY